jgi:hypothetical protein
MHWTSEADDLKRGQLKRECLFTAKYLIKLFLKKKGKVFSLGIVV